MTAVEKHTNNENISISHPLRYLRGRWKDLRKQLKDPRVTGPLALIYQMPKVGSQTIEATLQQSRLPHSIYRFHFLSDSRANFIAAAIRAKKNGELWEQYARLQLAMKEDLTHVLRTRRWLRYVRPNIPKVAIITGLRDPLSLTLSALFQNYSSHFRSPEEITPQACRELLLQSQAFPYIQEWFDTELKGVIGLDVYQKPFPIEQGYAIYENAWARVLVYRFETLPKLPGLLRQFLGCEISPLVDRNIGNAKEYSERYAYVKKHLRLPLDFVNAQCNSKMATHFFTAEERRQMIQRWAEPQQPSA